MLEKLIVVLVGLVFLPLLPFMRGVHHRGMNTKKHEKATERWGRLWVGNDPDEN